MIEETFHFSLPRSQMSQVSIGYILRTLARTCLTISCGCRLEIFYETCTSYAVSKSICNIFKSTLRLL